MATQQAWYDYPITQGHQKDDGDDLGTADNTPFAFWEPGQVIDAGYHVYGGQVVIRPDAGSGYDDYAIHLNKIYVQAGEHVSADEIVGTTGGGVGDLILKGGKVQPATSQSDYQGHSSNYHLEIGEFADDSAHGDMAQFNEGWGNRRRQRDPTSIIQALQSESPQLFMGSGNESQSGTQTLGLSNPLDPATWLNSLATAMGFSSPSNMALRLTGYTVGVVLVLGGVFVGIHGEQAVNVVVQGAAKAVKAAAV